MGPKHNPKAKAAPLDDDDESVLVHLQEDLRSGQQDADAGRTVTLSEADIERLKNGEWPESLD